MESVSGRKCVSMPADTKEWRGARREGWGQGRAEMVPTKRWNPQGVEEVGGITSVSHLLQG